MFFFFWLAAGGSPGEGHLGVPAGAPAASGLDVTEPEVWVESCYLCVSTKYISVSIKHDCSSQDTESCCLFMDA